MFTKQFTTHKIVMEHDRKDCSERQTCSNCREIHAWKDLKFPFCCIYLLVWKTVLLTFQHEWISEPFSLLVPVCISKSLEREHSAQQCSEYTECWHEVEPHRLIWVSLSWLQFISKQTFPQMTTVTARRMLFRGMLWSG